MCWILIPPTVYTNSLNLPHYFNNTVIIFQQYARKTEMEIFYDMNICAVP